MSPTRRSTTLPPETDGDTLAAWQRNSLIHATGPSGTVFVLRALTLDELAAEDALPDDLLRVALLEWSREVTGGVMGEMSANLKKGTPEALTAARKLSQDNLRLRNRIIVRALVKPRVTEKDLVKLDPYDLAMIAAISQRQVNIDAAGRRVGADTLDTFRAACQILARSETDEARKAVLLELSEVQ
jgi:hypothetical protein